MAVTRADKALELEQLEKAFKGSDSAILLNYKGLTVPQVTTALAANNSNARNTQSDRKASIGLTRAASLATSQAELPPPGKTSAKRSSRTPRA